MNAHKTNWSHARLQEAMLGFKVDETAPSQSTAAGSFGRLTGEARRAKRHREMAMETLAPGLRGGERSKGRRHSRTGAQAWPALVRTGTRQLPQRCTAPGYMACPWEATSSFFGIWYHARGSA